MLINIHEAAVNPSSILGENKWMKKIAIMLRAKPSKLFSCVPSSNSHPVELLEEDIGLEDTFCHYNE